MTKEEIDKIDIFLAFVNKVTAYHRHGNPIHKRDLDKLSDSQIEMEQWLRLKREVQNGRILFEMQS